MKIGFHCRLFHNSRLWCNTTEIWATQMAKNVNNDKKAAYYLLLWDFTSRKKSSSQKTSFTVLHQGLINCHPNTADISP